MKYFAGADPLHQPVVWLPGLGPGRAPARIDQAQRGGEQLAVWLPHREAARLHDHPHWQQPPLSHRSR